MELVIVENPYPTEQVDDDRTSVSQVRAKWEFTAQQDSQISFPSGAIITVTGQYPVESGWWHGEYQGQDGLFPINYTEVYQIEKVAYRKMSIKTSAVSNRIRLLQAQLGKLDEETPAPIATPEEKEQKEEVKVDKAPVKRTGVINFATGEVEEEEEEVEGSEDVEESEETEESEYEESEEDEEGLLEDSVSLEDSPEDSSVDKSANNISAESPSSVLLDKPEVTPEDVVGESKNEPEEKPTISLDKEPEESKSTISLEKTEEKLEVIEEVIPTISLDKSEDVKEKPTISLEKGPEEPKSTISLDKPEEAKKPEEITISLKKDEPGISLKKDEDEVKKPNRVVSVVGSDVATFLEKQADEEAIPEEKKSEPELVETIVIEQAPQSGGKQEKPVTFWDACASGNINRVKDLVAKGVNINKQNSEGSTGLHLAAKNSHYDIILFLLSKKAKISILDNQKQLPHSQIGCTAGSRQVLLEKITIEPEWVPDSASQNCLICAKQFTFLFRRHHCRNCGILACGNCTNNRAVIPSRSNGLPGAYKKQSSVRVCSYCHPIITSTQ